MADDLNDQWCCEEVTGDKFASVEVSLPADGKRGTKRTLIAGDKRPKSEESKKSVEPKAKKRKEKKKISHEPEELLSKAGEPEDLRAMMTKELKERLSPDALDDSLPSPDSDFFSCNVKCQPPSDYLKAILPRWREVMKKSLHMKKNGSPCVLVMTSSAVRAVELNRQLKAFYGDKCRVTKLFSKHIKIEEQKKFLASSVCQVGIGTPNRILMLIKQGSLQLESLVAVVLDWNWRDAKLKRLADIPQIRGDLTSLLKNHLLETVQGSPCKIALL